MFSNWSLFNRTWQKRRREVDDQSSLLADTLKRQEVNVLRVAVCCSVMKHQELNVSRVAVCCSVMKHQEVNVLRNDFRDTLKRHL